MFKLVKIIPIKTNFKVMRHNTLFAAIALAFALASVFILATKPLNYGIDFSGGLILEVQTQGKADIEEFRRELSRYSPTIQALGDTGDVVSIYLAQGDKNEAEITAELADLKQILGDKVAYRNTQIVGPKVGADLIRNGIIAVLLSILTISLYIGVRFELPFAAGSVISLAHDVLLAMAMLAATGFEFGLTTLAALLTLAGYSINDTVVIYDRIRENMRKYRTKPMAETIDLSINETFSRTVLTGLTTIFAVAAIYLFGGEVLRGFSAVMLFGIIIGTYSSVFISTSTLLLFKKKSVQGTQWGEN
jgi:preprotein translocase SecF subunit